MTATVPTGPGDVHPDTREVLELLIGRGYSADTQIAVASLLRHDRRSRTELTSREIYDDSDDGGYEPGSYFAHAMGKDD